MTEQELTLLKNKLDRIEINTLLAAKNVLTLEDVVLITGLSKGHIYRLTSTREIPHYKPNGRNKVYFKKSEIEEWLLQNRIATTEEIDNWATTYVATHKRYNR